MYNIHTVFVLYNSFIQGKYSVNSYTETTNTQSKKLGKRFIIWLEENSFCFIFQGLLIRIFTGQVRDIGIWFLGVVSGIVLFWLDIE